MASTTGVRHDQASTGMAAIGPVLLDIQKIPNNLDAKVEVSCTVTFDQADIDTNRSYDVTVELIGADDGPLNTRDEVIRFGTAPFFTSRSALRADGQASKPFTTHQRSVSLRLLNEDRPGRDEIRARVILVSGTSRVSRDSNLAIDDYNPAHA
jgi:hypothetical protein